GSTIVEKWSNSSLAGRVGLVTSVALGVIGAIVLTHGAALGAAGAYLAYSAFAGVGIAGLVTAVKVRQAAQHSVNPLDPPQLSSKQGRGPNVSYGFAESIGRTGSGNTSHPQEDRIVEGKVKWGR